ncbi:unnamed protein product [Ambrosiozyma monospora]|uniref:Unnamed protein product n=1 Tax=Ambrosiozyma monospora TaxID=43982 RepID=A0ACB5SXY0_AMBMO|nr:unnamed protein product [Ambrosiozyma monospora]
MNERHRIVLEELAEVEPLIEEAQRGVKDIKKQHLTELRSMLNPPEAVKLTLESVSILLGYDVGTWRDVISVIRRDDFISNIVAFDSERHLTKELSDYMEVNYMSRRNYNFEAVNRASKACGPLLLWVQAQLRYAKIVKKVEPLRREVAKVEIELRTTKQKQIALDGMISDLQANIENYKSSYSGIIRETEYIKSEMQDVELKVVRSKTLLESLSEERARWGTSIHSFRDQRDNLVGDSILAASCMSYLGSFDQLQRHNIIKKWQTKLSSSGVHFNKNFQFITSVAKSSGILSWQQSGLPNDELFLENASILTSRNSDLFSFIIDPSGQIIDFLTNYEKPKELVVTSFLDDGFVKQLESCIRFGGSVLIQDGEYFDPLVSRVIAKEIELSGGRSLVRIGDKAIDLSPNFKLFIHTKDPSVKISPFISSRMNVLNFTFTPASLITQSLNTVLKHENPESEQQRLEMLKVNGEWKQKVKDLEDDLLLSLNSSEKSILDNNELVDKLEVIKSEVGTIKRKMKESENVIEETEASMKVYQPIADLYARLYMMLTKAWKLNPIYRFSDSHLDLLLQKVLDQAKGKGVEHTVNLFIKQVYGSIAVSLLQKDRAILKSLLYSISQKSPELEETPLSDIIKESGLFVLRSSEGFDSTSAITENAKSSGREIVKYSMGSSKGMEIATRLIASAAKKGKWLVIENVQMSTELLDSIPKLYKEQNDFKLFLTCQIDSKLPIVLSKMSRQIIFEANPGIKLLLEDTLLSKSSALYLNDTAIQPLECKKLYFGLSWVYAVLKEKLRYVPIGFKKKYEFNEGDLKFSKFIIDQTIKSMAGSKSNVSPEVIPYDIIFNYIGRIVFGGKIDDDKDLQSVMKFARTLFNIVLFDNNFNMLEGVCPDEKLIAPESYKFEDYTKWISDLPDVEPAEWLGLPKNSDKVMKDEETKRVNLESGKIYEDVISCF